MRAEKFEQVHRDTPSVAHIESWIARKVAEMGDDEAREYRADMERASAHIIEVFGVDEAFFEKAVSREVYGALCEQLAENDWLPEGEVKANERAFLTRFTRAFIGKASRVNREAAAAGDESARQCVNAEDTPENLEERVTIERVRTNADVERSARLQELVSQDCEVLHGIRTQLGITLENQRPFTVIVAQVDNFPRWDNVAKKSLPSGWDMLITNGVGKAPGAFVQRLANGEQYLVLNQHEGKVVLGEKKDYEELAMKHFRHEYVHTQRDFTVGPDLGHIFDELLAGDAANDSSHMSTRWLMNFLSRDLESEGQTSLWETFRTSEREDGGASFYRRFADEFGSRALLATLATKPRNYEVSRLIGDVPEVRSSPNERMGDLFAVILAGAKRRYPDIERHTRDRYEVLEPESARNVLMASNYQKFRFPSSWQKALEERAART